MIAASDRRFNYRVPLGIYLNEYERDRPHRALTVNISETGLYTNRVLDLYPLSRESSVVGLEFELPGTGESIWARGEVCHDSFDPLFHGQGIRFTGMPRIHLRMLRDFCVEWRRRQLCGVLDRVRRARYC
jgi:hypothetical protein